MTDEELVTRNQQIKEMGGMLWEHYRYTHPVSDPRELPRHDKNMVEDYIAAIVDIDMAIMFRHPRRLDTIEKLAADRVECERFAAGEAAYRARRDAAKADHYSLYA